MSTKHPITVYSVMMILSVIFMALACLYMLFEFNRYDGPPRVRMESNRIGSNWS